MTGQDPYVAPEAAVSDPLDYAASMRWRRIVLWAMAILLVRAVVYATSGFIGSAHEIYGVEVDDIIASTATFLLYFVFLRTISSRHFQQMAAVFFVTFLLDLVSSIAIYRILSVLVGKPAQAIFQSEDLVTPAGVCMLAFVAWYAFARKPIA